MNSILVAAVTLIVAFIAGIFYNRRGNQQSAQVIDLSSKIKETEDQAATEQTTADQKVKEYQDALKQYDPDFYNDDGDSGGGKPSA